MHQRAPHRYYRFGPNVLDCLRGVLWQDGQQVSLTPRVFDILTTLVQRHGELVTKDDFMRLVWGGVAVEDNNLARQISTVRKVLHERPGQREYVATVTGVGYRFVGSVTAFDELPDDLQALVDHAHTAVPHGPTPVVVQVADAPLPQQPIEDAATFSAALPAGAAEDALPAVSSLPGTTGPNSPWGLAVGGLAVVALAVVLIWPDRTTSAANVSRTLSQFTHGSGSQFDPAWSPEGNRLAVASDRNGNADIWVYGINDATSTQLTTSNAHDWQPDWSPDGRTLTFRSEREGGGIYLASASGGDERRLATFGSRPRWSPKGDTILFTHTEPDSAVAVRLFIVDASGGTPRRVTHPALAGLQVTNAAWSPDGRVSVWTRDEVGGRQFLTVPLDGGSATRSALPEEFSTVAARTQLAAFSWAPSGRYIYFEGRTRSVRNVWRVTVDPVTLDWMQGPEQLTIGPGADVGAALSPDGSRLSFAVNTAKPGIWSFPFDQQTGRIDPNGQQFISASSGERSGDVTDDGQKVAYRLDRENRQEIWTRRIDGEPQLLVSEAGWDVSAPKWSPDEARIVYQRRSRSSAGVPDRRAVVVMDVAGADRTPVEVLPIAEGQDVLPTDWRADGQAILSACRLAVADPLGVCELTLPVGSATPARLKQLAVEPGLSLYQQRYAPNQRWISFMAVPRKDRSASTIYVIPSGGGPWRPVTDGQAYDDKPRWSADGRSIFFISNRDGRFEVWGRRFDPDAGRAEGPPFRLTSLEGARQILSPYLTDMEMFITPTRVFLPMFETSSRVWILDQADQ